MQPTNAYRVWRDSSMYTLIAANIYTLVLVLTQRLSLADVLWLYWLQSALIGFTTIIRILSLKNFSTDGFRINGHAVSATTAIKIFVAGFFMIHFGIFQTVYAIFLAVLTVRLTHAGHPFSFTALLVPLALFAIHHIYSLLQTLRLKAGSTNIGKIMFAPYKRIIPMHVTILVGVWLIANIQVAMLAGLFVGLKTIVDVSAHYFEHHSKVVSAPLMPTVTNAIENTVDRAN